MADKITASDLIASDVIKELQKLNKELAESVSIMSKLSKASIELNKDLKESANSQEKLSNATEKVKNNKIQLTQAEKDLQRIETLQQKVIEQTAGSYNQLSSKLNLLRTQYRNLNEEQQKSKGGAMLKDIQQLDKKLKDFDKTMGQSQRNVGNYGSAFSGLKSSVMGFLGIFGGAAAVIGTFKKVIGATGESEDKYERAMTQAKAATDLFFKSLASGDFSNFKNRLNEVVKAAGEYFDIMDKLEDKTRSLGVQEAKQNVEMQKLLIIMKDQTKTNEQRIEAIDKLEKIEKGLAGERVATTEAAYTAQLKFVAKMTGLHESRIKKYVEEYNSVEGIIEVGTKYNDLVKEKEKLENIPNKTDQAWAKLKVIKDDIAAMGYNAKVAGIIASKYNSQTKAEYDSLAEKAKAYYGAVSSADENLQRAYARRSSLIEEMAKKDQKASDDAIAARKKQTDALAADLEKRKSLELQLISIRSQAESDLLENTNKENEKAVDELYTDTEKYLNDYFKKESEIDDLRLKKRFETVDAMIEKEKEMAEVRKEIQSMSIDMVMGLGELTNTIYDGQLQKLEENKEKELAAAGDNAKKKEKIEKEYALKAAAVKRKQATIEKVSALFNIAMNTAMGVTSALSKVVTIPLVPYIIANGAIQAAMVAAKPIPKFAKGVRNFEGGFAEVGEAGAEALRTPDGNIFLSPDKATRMALPKGTDVFTHNETKQMLSQGVSMEKFDELIKEQRETRKALSRKSGKQLNITPRGWVETDTMVSARKTYIDKYFRI